MKFPVTPSTWCEVLGDILMTPVMYLLQGNFFESPQRTHFWNNTKLPIAELSWIDASMMVSVTSDRKAVRRWFGLVPIFHMPIFGGWKEYVVVEPVVPQPEWYVGWIAGDVAGISHIQLNGQVRLLLGPGPAQFFGADGHGNQIPLRICGYGTLGTRSPYSGVTLL